MTSHLDRWEKDPFFSAAEEVQESADRMESTYRTLIHASKEPSVWNSEALRRDLRTALGTTKWQLEEFERAVACSYTKASTDDTKDMHRDFISAIKSHVSRVEGSWNDSFSTGKPPRPWVRLNEGEQKELALFLTGSGVPGYEQPAKIRFNDERIGRRKQKAEGKEEKFSGHRRAASASAEIGSWNITVDDDVSLRGKIEPPPRKIPSFSGLLNTLEYSTSKLMWPKNGYRKLKVVDQRQEETDDTSLETQPLTRDLKASQERSKSYSEQYNDHYDKRFHGWYDAVKRRLQRSQYYMLYRRRTQLIFWILIVICLLGLVVIHLV